VRKRTIIILSLISAFVLMSGGYGSWQKPLIITGKIKVVEPPPPPKVDVAPINIEKLDPNQSITVNPKGPNNSQESENEALESVEAIDTIDNPQDTVIMPVDQAANIEEENSGSVANTEHEPAGVDTIVSEDSGDISAYEPEVADEASENIIEDQRSE
jgi:hypothetical protein